MIVKINDRQIPTNIGNKAKSLMVMKTVGFEVPNGFILDSDTFNEVVEYNKKKERIEDLLSKTNLANVKENCLLIAKLFDDFVLPENIVEDINSNIKAGKYAVRSSGIKEDLDNYSFAGQYDTFLNLDGIVAITKAVVDCYKSMFSENIITYFLNNNIPLVNLEMAIIIQEMVDADKSGVVFTINPLTGNDKEMVAEVAKGLGENIVSGKVNPELYLHNWFDNNCDFSDSNCLLNSQEMTNLFKVSHAIMLHFGYPCDIEFAIKEEKLYILQARAVTKIMYSQISDQWSTADFKDGGVSATVCTPFMWSLYEYIWDTTLSKFMLELKLIKKKDIHKLGQMFYGRPYWNMTMVKQCMAKVPGYKERSFDEEFGVKITYEGNGVETKISLKLLFDLIKTAWCQRKIVRKQNDTVSSFKEEYLNKYHNYLTSDFNEDIDGVWYELVKNVYLQSEGTYFWQIFINTVHQSLFKDSLLKYVSESEYLNLISGLDNISHLLPFYDMWNITRKIKADESCFDYWRNADISSIKTLYENKSTKYFIPELRTYLNNYGYHSEKELDVTYPCYYEDVEKVIKMFKDTLELDDSCSPIIDRQTQSTKYQEQLSKVKSSVSSQKFAKIVKKIDTMRNMLWWREELRDISTRFYYIIRIYTLELAESYVKRGIISSIDDIWFLAISDIFAFMNNELDIDSIQDILERNKKYYNSFRNYLSENEIGSVFDNEGTNNHNDPNQIKGIGCNNGVVIGTARVIENLSEIDRLNVDDILITKFTDTGWTNKFAILKGIVTEYGGILCHAAIISREYGIPCVVCCHNATQKIKDGSTISINGATGEVLIIKE
jgi:Phosphoenolpyruvate synthase/pyruvate phosphate dikinase